MTEHREFASRVRREWKARRDQLSTRIAGQLGEWMSIPAWARWFRMAYRVLRRDLTSHGEDRRW